LAEFRQLRNVGSDAPRFITLQQLGGGAPTRFVLEIDFP
jgi:hypothetical protein